MTKSPATTPIPVQLSEPEFIAFIFPHLSMPRRGPKCKLGYHRVFNLIPWVLYTGMQWKCPPVPRTGDGRAGIHYTTIYRVFAKWADDGSLEQAFIASGGHLAAHHHLDGDRPGLVRNREPVEVVRRQSGVEAQRNTAHLGSRVPGVEDGAVRRGRREADAPHPSLVAHAIHRTEAGPGGESR